MEALTKLAWKVGCDPSDELGGHDAICEGQYISPLGSTPCECEDRRQMVEAALAARTPPQEPPIDLVHAALAGAAPTPPQDAR